jgi:competence protein ComEA
VDSLILLPGIGPVLAERLENARTGQRSFRRWEELLAVRGIGPKRVEQLKKLAEKDG